MGQTPSSPVRQDNASTRTLHSSSLNSRRPTSFFRRLTRRLHSHPARRFGRQRHNPASGNRTGSSAIQNETSSRRRLPESTSSSASTTSSVRRATVAATRAAAAATGPLPPLPSFNVDSHIIPPSTASSAASTNSAISNTSDLSHMLSEIIASAVFSALPSNRSQQQQQQDNTSSATTENDHGNSFFRYVQMPLRSQHSSSEQSQEQQQQQQSGSQQTSDQQQRVLPIIIVGYRTSPTSSSSAATNDPPQSGSNRRPRSTLSTSSSLATLQSMPLSVHSNRTAATTQQQQQQPSTTTSSSNTAAADPGQWVIYVLSGQPMNTTISTLPDNPTYEDLLWLSNIIGPARPVTTTQAAIDATLPVTPWSDDTKRRMRGAERCLVCLDDFVPKQSVRVLKCCHVFHKECVDRWLCETHNSCPICRGVPVDPQFVEQEQAQ